MGEPEHLRGGEQKYPMFNGAADFAVLWVHGVCKKEAFVTADQDFLKEGSAKIA